MILPWMKKSVLTLLSLLMMTLPVFAEGQDPDFMRSMGKMYVVVAVIVSMFIGMVIFMIYMERRISQLEKEMEE